MRSPNTHFDLKYRWWASPILKEFFLISMIAVALLLTFTASATADTLTGNVKNATIGKPASGDEVVLLNLAQGMQEAANEDGR